MRFQELIGNTPLVELERIPRSEGVPPSVRILGKLEGDNPGGSVKDRAAWGMISGALERGEIAPGDRLVEATSGNTGIALAMVAGRLGVGMTLIVPLSATKERVLTMEAYGADVIRTAEGETIEDARRLAERLARERGWGQLNQFANPDNWRMHYRTTGPEVWADTEGTVTHFVSSMGTTGTIMGTSRYLKEVSEAAVREGARPAPVTIVGVQPVEGSRIPGIRKWSPEMTPAIYEPERVDALEYVSADEATGMARRLAREEGILGGMSSGGALTAALRVGRSLEEGTVVFIVCDRGDRYLSSGLFGEGSA